MSIAKTYNFGTSCVSNIFLSEWTSRDNKSIEERVYWLVLKDASIIFGYE